MQRNPHAGPDQNVGVKCVRYRRQWKCLEHGFYIRFFPSEHSLSQCNLLETSEFKAENKSYSQYSHGQRMS